MNYYSKYIKYKNKYIDLSNKIGGSKHSITPHRELEHHDSSKSMPSHDLQNIFDNYYFTSPKMFQGYFDEFNYFLLIHSNNMQPYAEGEFILVDQDKIKIENINFVFLSKEDIQTAAKAANISSLDAYMEKYTEDKLNNYTIYVGVNKLPYHSHLFNLQQIFDEHLFQLSSDKDFSEFPFYLLIEESKLKKSSKTNGKYFKLELANGINGQHIKYEFLSKEDIHKFAIKFNMPVHRYMERYMKDYHLINYSCYFGKLTETVDEKEKILNLQQIFDKYNFCVSHIPHDNEYYFSEYAFYLLIKEPKLKQNPGNEYIKLELANGTDKQSIQYEFLSNDDIRNSADDNKISIATYMKQYIQNNSLQDYSHYVGTLAQNSR